VAPERRLLLEVREPLLAGADAHGLADELRVLPPLDADVERVHIDVEDHTRHGPWKDGRPD